MNKDNGGPAFPTATQVEQNQATGETTIHQYLSDGMTMRDYFAAKAMQAIMASDESDGSEWALIAKSAYYAADAMLEARNKE